MMRMFGLVSALEIASKRSERRQIKGIVFSLIFSYGNPSSNKKMNQLIREYSESDLEDCLTIYRANREAGFIPQGYEQEFVETLKNKASLTLVIEVDGELLGCGSVAYLNQEGSYFANLSFGLIHPDHHRRKYGSILLVARLALLTENEGRSLAYLSAIKSSVGFYSGVVGFSEYDRTEDEFGNHFYELCLELGPVRLRDAQEYLAGSDFSMSPNLKVPIAEVTDTQIWQREW